MLLFPRTYGLEFFVLPILALPYFYYVSDFTLPGALFNNCILSFVMAGLAWWRSTAIAATIPRSATRHRLDPAWPAFASMTLVFLAVLQLILSVAHLSYYRKGPLVPDLFEN